MNNNFSPVLQKKKRVLSLTQWFTDSVKCEWKNIDVFLFYYVTCTTTQMKKKKQLIFLFLSVPEQKCLFNFVVFVAVYLQQQLS